MRALQARMVLHRNKGLLTAEEAAVNSLQFLKLFVDCVHRELRHRYLNSNLFSPTPPLLNTLH